MNIRSQFLVVALSVVSTMSEHSNETQEYRESEKQIQDAFKAAYSNRSEELHEFFNQTFGGDPSEIADRFKESWDDASEGVKQFISETYHNISRVMNGTNSSSEYPSASLSSGKEYDELKEKLTHADHELEKESPETHDMVDSAWQYFKSVFGVDPRDKKTPTASMPVQQTHTGGVFLGLITLAAALFLMWQTSFATSRRTVTTGWSKQRMTSEIPSGYVRLA